MKWPKNHGQENHEIKVSNVLTLTFLLLLLAQALWKRQKGRFLNPLLNIMKSVCHFFGCLFFFPNFKEFWQNTFSHRQKDVVGHLGHTVQNPIQPLPTSWHNLWLLYHLSSLFPTQEWNLERRERCKTTIYHDCLAIFKTTVTEKRLQYLHRLLWIHPVWSLSSLKERPVSFWLFFDTLLFFDTFHSGCNVLELCCEGDVLTQRVLWCMNSHKHCQQRPDLQCQPHKQFVPQLP